MERREVLTGAAAAAMAAGATGAFAVPAAGSAGPESGDVADALARFRGSIPRNFDPGYVQHVLIPYFLTSVYLGEQLLLPTIDPSLTKENAFPAEWLGLMYKEWVPSRDEGVTVFLQGLEHRGENNLRKRIYMTAVTLDLYAPKYQSKVTGFFDALLDSKFSGQPFMRHYLDYYFDIYWDLHVGVKGAAVPAEIREVGEAFNTVLAYLDPRMPLVHDNYMRVRGKLDFLNTWIEARVGDVADGRVADPDRTFAHYWLKNAGDGQHFSRKDIVFECFHNFVALSQWGATIFQIMLRLREDGGDPAIRAAYEKTMRGDYDNAKGASYTPLQLFVMELFRTISSNAGSVSTLSDARASFDGPSPFQSLGLPYERHSYIVTPHPPTNMDRRLWPQPEVFDPERYLSVPTVSQMDQAKCHQIGLTECPFSGAGMKVADGRDASIQNSGFGTVFAVVDGKPGEVCDHAGFAPFGFGYRRCPGELLTIQVFAEFLRKSWVEKIAFRKLNLAAPGRVPVGPGTVIDDDISFYRRA